MDVDDGEVIRLLNEQLRVKRELAAAVARREPEAIIEAHLAESKRLRAMAAELAPKRPAVAVAEPVQSPIEEAMHEALSARLPDGLVMRRQRQIGRYAADFTVEGPSCRIVVECDGHEFHERTKEQAEHDRRRDREMQADGWLVLRFTGREIHRNADGCACEVVRAITRTTGRQP